MEGVSIWPARVALRDWQVRARAAWGSHPGIDFLLVATPGAGKTNTALRIASDELQAGRVDRVVIVVPSDHLRRQWADKAKELGLELNPDWGGESTDGKGYCGIVVTYHQVARYPEIQHKLCRARTLAILDEVHHAADTRTWGDALRQAFGAAVRRLMLSGTPFRSDNMAIPFVSYRDGRSLADFAYTYMEALTDGIARVVHFPNYEGSFEWEQRGSLVRAAFRDEIPEEQARRRLRTALDDRGEWLPSIIRQADRKLSEERQRGHSSAGGLIVCIDQWHAKKVAEIVRRVTGSMPIVATSDDPDASSKITDFSRSADRWLVAVRMVSEGIDLPRLRVGVYATNIISELYFRQLVGRFVRIVPGIEAYDQPAWLYLPSEPTLVSYAYAVKEERDHQMEEVIRQEQRLREAMVSDDGRLKGEFTPLSATNPQLTSVIIGDVELQPPDIDFAHRVKMMSDMGNMADEQVALLLRNASLLSGGRASPEMTPPGQPIEEAKPLYQLRKNLRQQSSRLVAKLVAKSGATYEEIGRWLIDETGTSAKEASVEQLERRIALLTARLEGAPDDDRISRR